MDLKILFGGTMDDYFPDPYEIERKVEKRQVEARLESCELVGQDAEHCENVCPQYPRCKKYW